MSYRLMKKQIWLIILFAIPFFAFKQVDVIAGKYTGWKAGVASAIVTPEGSMWQDGFSFRNRPSEGVTTDVWAKALALEDANGLKVVIVTIDNSGIEKDLSDKIRERLKSTYNLSKDQIIINCSHTHTGPAATYRYLTNLKDEKEKAKIVSYAARLEDQVIELTGKSLSSLEPVKIFSGSGVVRFQVNRRNNIQYKLQLQEKFNGPNDYAVPVMKIEKASGGILAVLFGYACHSSMLRDYKISGDYPAFARMELEKIYPGATSIFFQGAGGNQIGYPRSSFEAARQAGKSLAAAVERVVSEPMQELSPSLSTSYSEINLELEGTQHDTYPYPIQVWKIGEQPLITLGGEPVIEYAIQLKLIFGQDAFIMGYSNDVMAYMGTPLVLSEGGYEGNDSSIPVDGKGRWALNIESKIIQGVLKLARQVGLEMAPKKFAIPGG